MKEPFKGLMLCTTDYAFAAAFFRNRPSVAKTDPNIQTAAGNGTGVVIVVILMNFLSIHAELV